MKLPSARDIEGNAVITAANVLREIGVGIIPTSFGNRKKRGIDFPPENALTMPRSLTKNPSREW